MKKFLLTLILILTFLLGFSQEKKNITFGVGSRDELLFNDIKEYCQNNRDVQLVNYCEQHKIISVQSLNEKYKDPMDFVNMLSKTFNVIIWLKKDDILYMDCKNEIIKQQK